VSERTPREEILYEAAELITGDRNKTYGSPTQNFQDTAALWTVLLRHKLKDGESLTPGDVAKLMIALKLARMTAQNKKDNWLDAAGYAGCGYEAELETGGLIDAPVELWTGTYQSPEPPPHVWVLRITNRTDPTDLLYRNNRNKWIFSDRTDYTDAEWEARMNNESFGFKWDENFLVIPDYEFVDATAEVDSKGFRY
jgi:hypothetical protein